MHKEQLVLLAFTLPTNIFGSPKTERVKFIIAHDKHFRITVKLILSGKELCAHSYVTITQSS
jgi:hypothetical protein